MSPTPSCYVRSVLSKIGLACGAACSNRPNTSTPYWSHSLLDYFINTVGWSALFVRYSHGLHRSIRKRALMKAQRQAAKIE
jgi:17beta-estradiol 17-dehydrogenase / very-long-chain 3-oxoacyl-CoA reductase